MNADLAPLIELQTLDLRITELVEQQRKIPVMLESAEAPLIQARALQKQTVSTQEALGKERRDRERDLEAQESQVEKFRARLSELKTNREYQAALFEIEMANKRKREIEDQVLGLMERLEKGQQELRESERRVAETAEAFSRQKQEAESRQATLAADLSGLYEQQKSKTRLLDKSLLDRYLKLKAGRKEQAVVPVRNGICTGCRLQLPPQLVAEVKRGDALLSCSYCQRILFWDGEPAGEAPSGGPVSVGRETVPARAKS